MARTDERRMTRAANRPSSRQRAAIRSSDVAAEAGRPPIGPPSGKSELPTSLSDVGRAMAGAIGITPSEVGFGRFGHGIGCTFLSRHPYEDDDTILETGVTICI